MLSWCCWSLSGLLSLVGAIGLVRLKGISAARHAPALAKHLGRACLALASVVYFDRRSRAGVAL